MMNIKSAKKLVQYDGYDNLYTTSLIVAKAFAKEHKNVLRDIENLECSDEFNALNYYLFEYKDNNGEIRQGYQISRDGFAFLAMGYTGNKAVKWKERFLAAFNFMQKELIQRHIQRLLQSLEKENL